MVNNRPIKIRIDTGSPVPLILESQFNKVIALKPITVDYRGENDNKIKVKEKLQQTLNWTVQSINWNHNQKHTPITWSRLDGKAGNHPRIRKIQPKHQPHKQDGKHSKPRYNDTKALAQQTI